MAIAQHRGHKHSIWLRRLIAAGAVVFGGFVVLTAVVLAVFYWPLSERAMVSRALDLGRLAALPPSASGVHADGTSNLFSMTYLLRFDAPADEIAAFVAQSPGLRGVAPEQFTAGHMMLQRPAGGGVPADGHRRFRLDPRYPWFDPTVRLRGRRYEIPQDANARWGEVIIDDERNTVFVQTHRS